MENTESQSFEYINGGLTEDEVKRRFVPFLKDFYKHRYEPAADSFSVNLDNVSAEGFVADVVMTFKKKDGSPFTCACEATSRDKIGEVKFSLNFVYFRWDAAAFGAFFSALSYSFFYNTQFLWLLNLSLAGNLGLIIGMFLIGFFGWYFTMQGWRKYRYIYAIEQFKKYRADEQWIALAEDVFLAANDPYLVELKNQCIYNGFGLAIVPQEGAIRSLISPSRLGVFGENRKMTHWVTRSDWYQKMTQTMPSMNRLAPPDMVRASWNKTKSWAEYLVIEPFKKHIWSILSKPFGQSKNVYSRFMSGQTVQKWLFGLCLLVIAPMCFDVLTYSEEDTTDIEIIRKGPFGENPEDEEGGIVDDSPVAFQRKSGGVPKQYPIFREQSTEEKYAPPRNPSGFRERRDEYAEPLSKKTQTSSADPCAKLSGQTGWIVQENRNYGIQDEAASWAGQFRNRGGIKGAYPIPRSCFEIGAEGYIVWFGSVYATETEAQSAAAEYEKALQEKEIAGVKLVAVKI